MNSNESNRGLLRNTLLIETARRVALAITVFVLSLECWAGQPTDPKIVRERIELQCGSHRVAIKCGRALTGEPQDDRVCVHNSLFFAAENATEALVKTPVEYLRDRGTPAGLSCSMGIDGNNYVTVIYTFCGVLACRVYDLYTESGRRITVKKKRANQEYDRVAGQLEIPFDDAPNMIEE